MIIHGDALTAMKLIKDESINLILTDPPYNLVEKIGELHVFRQAEKNAETSGNMDINISPENMHYDTGFDQLSWLNAAVPKLKKGGHIIIFNDWENMPRISDRLKTLGINVKTINHWQKTNPLPSEWRRRFVPGREYFLHGVRKGARYVFNVDSLHNGVFTMGLTKQSEKSHGKHPNQKPVKLMSELIEILTHENATILDPFMGSGSTGVSCEETNRRFVGVELDKDYYTLAQNRINESIKVNSASTTKGEIDCLQDWLL